jgi:hypothetical protein
MRTPSKLNLPLLKPLVGALLTASALAHAGPVEDAARFYKLDEIQSLEYSGTGHWFQFGSCHGPSLT